MPARRGLELFGEQLSGCCSLSLSMSVCLCRHFVICLGFFSLCDLAPIHQLLPLSFPLEGLTWFWDRDEATRFLVCICRGGGDCLLLRQNLAYLYSFRKRHRFKGSDDREKWTETLPQLYGGLWGGLLIAGVSGLGSPQRAQEQ